MSLLDAASAATECSVALAHARRAARILARVVGIAHPDHASARVTIGRALQAGGRLRAALPYFEDAVAALVRVRGGGTAVAELTVDAMLALARCLQELGRLAEARGHARVALRIARRRIGARAVLTATAHNTLGVIGKFAGRFAEAERHYRAALPVMRRRFGASSREVATLLHNLGGLEHARGNFARGEVHARRSVEIARALMRPDDPERIAHEVAYAALLDGLDRHTESLPIYRRALAAFTKRFGRRHYEVASTLHNLAAAEQALGRVRAAEAHYAEAGALLSRVRGKDHPDVALTHYNLAILRRDAGRTTSARALLVGALATFRRHLGERHPQTVGCKAALAELSRTSTR